MTDVWLVGKRRLGLAFALGALAALGQAPIGFWWATLLALAALIWVLQRTTDSRDRRIERLHVTRRTRGHRTRVQ